MNSLKYINFKEFSSIFVERYAADDENTYMVSFYGLESIVKSVLGAISSKALDAFSYKSNTLKNIKMLEHRISKVENKLFPGLQHCILYDGCLTDIDNSLEAIAIGKGEIKSRLISMATVFIKDEWLDDLILELASPYYTYKKQSIFKLKTHGFDEEVYLIKFADTFQVAEIVSSMIKQGVLK